MKPPTEFIHDPVMCDEIVEIIASLHSGVFADLTLGGAGHAAAALNSNPGLVVHGVDRDDDALAAAAQHLLDFGARAVTHKARFDRTATVLQSLDIREISGFLMDLGVSSPQLDRADRGFSYRLSGPLDMRMDPGQATTAADVVNSYAPGELIDVLRSYGDERFASRIVEAIVTNRPISTTSELAEIIAEAIPAAARRKSTGHPAKRSFQAIRIEVNDELSILADTVDSMISMLASGGVGLVLTYHSGEDRIVKDRMRRAVEAGSLPGMPATSDFEWLFRGARTASEDELERNPRARSARLRAIRRSAVS
ncbi:MAG: 16S rRNA (cytosine1402-N4)-methyltransferase [Verrucomicrobiales bacterium]|jgi:16S rRNA (cytosine1402-N4)-methyltransferase